jgi:hypothetical protein
VKRLSPSLLLAAVVAVVYLNSFRGVFQYDDYNVIVDNGGVHTWGAWLAGLPRGIRPLLKFTYTLNWTSGLGLLGFTRRTRSSSSAWHRGSAARPSPGSPPCFRRSCSPSTRCRRRR